MYANAHLRLRKRRLPGYYMEMYCQACGSIFPATSTGAVCKHCRSSEVIPGDKWLPVKDRVIGGANEVQRLQG